MLTKVQKWGNSQGIRIPKNLLEKSQIRIGEEVEITIEDEKIIIESTNKVRGKYDIAELAQKVPKDYNSEEENRGAPVGKEVW